MRLLRAECCYTYTRKLGHHRFAEPFHQHLTRSRQFRHAALVTVDDHGDSATREDGERAAGLEKASGVGQEGGNVKEVHAGGGRDHVSAGIRPRIASSRASANRQAGLVYSSLPQTFFADLELGLTGIGGFDMLKALEEKRGQRAVASPMVDDEIPASASLGVIVVDDVEHALLVRGTSPGILRPVDVGLLGAEDVVDLGSHPWLFGFDEGWRPRDQKGRLLMPRRAIAVLTPAASTCRLPSCWIPHSPICRQRLLSPPCAAAVRLSLVHIASQPGSCPAVILRPCLPRSKLAEEGVRPAFAMM